MSEVLRVPPSPVAKLGPVFPNGGATVFRLGETPGDGDGVVTSAAEDDE